MHMAEAGKKADLVRAYVGLGSNVGRRLDHLCFAYRQFRRHPHIRVTAASPVYESEAHTIGSQPRPAFLNAVIELETTLRPIDLLGLCLETEREAGRDRAASEPWAPRTLDIDVLIFGNVRMQERDLTLPHPRIGERRFVLQPLADLAPEARLPAPFSASVDELLATCPDESWIRRFSETLADDCVDKDLG